MPYDGRNIAHQCGGEKYDPKIMASDKSYEGLKSCVVAGIFFAGWHLAATFHGFWKWAGVGILISIVLVTVFAIYAETFEDVANELREAELINDE